ncbi:MAG: hypothetical protein AAGF20_09400 [Pseudomonadota bacterium]
MRLLGLALTISALTACVPTTRYNYVTPTEQNFQSAVSAAQGERVAPFVHGAIPLCRGDLDPVMVYQPIFTENQICDGRDSPEDRRCYARDAVISVGVAYVTTSASAIPYAAAYAGDCKTDKDTQ